MGVAEFLALASIATKLLGFLAEQKKTAERTGAWTPEERAAVNARWEQIVESKAWKTDEEGG